jgi:neutral ceramidase
MSDNQPVTTAMSVAALLLPLQAITAAHEDLAPAAVSYASGQLLGANINRSPTAYLANPAAERAAYEYDVDKDMDLLRIETLSSTSIIFAAGSGNKSIAGDLENVRGLISWFPVHCTSMNNTNAYVSGDNKGAAAQLVEKAWSKQQASRRSAAVSHSSASSASRIKVTGSVYAVRRSRVGACSSSSTSSNQSWLGWHWQLLKCLLLRGEPAAASGAKEYYVAAAAGRTGRQTGSSFVAAFAQSSVGDTSPNVQGPFCLDTGAG